MQALRGWAITAGLIFAATAVNAQAAPQQAGTPQIQPASDFSEPYVDGPPPAVAPQVAVPEYGPAVPPQAAVVPQQYGPGVPPSLLPPTEVYSVLRESGFSPLGVPRLRGLFYSIAAVNRRGDDGRVVIDARNGQIVRFVPAYRYGGDGYYDGRPAFYAPYAPLSRFDSPPRPPVAVPRVASRMPPTVPVPKAAPARPNDARPLAEKPAPVQQSAAVQIKPADAPQAAAPAVEAAKPAAPSIQATKPMPRVQGLE